MVETFFDKLNRA